MSSNSNYNLHGIIGKQPALSASKVFFALLSGAMLTASFPPSKLSFLAWFALVPLLKAIDNESFFGAFKYGFIAGAVHYLTLLYWIVVVLERYGSLNAIVSLGPLILLCLYLALYPAFFSALTTYLTGSRFFLLFMPGIWVGLEYVRAKLLTGFPWCLLGYTQYDHLHFIQVADLCGVYGVSFLIVLLNGLVYHLFFHLYNKNRRLLKWEVLITALLVSATLAYGHFRLSADKREKEVRRQVNAVVIQGNIDQSLKWETSYQAKTMETYQRLTRAAFDFNPELIVWPETSVPFFFQDDVNFSPKIYLLSRESDTLLVFGSPAYKKHYEKTKYYNRAYLITPDNTPPQYYDKVRLVPFGEYIPLKKYLFFINRLVPAAGDFEQGNRVAPLKGKHLSMGVLICFEAIFPDLARAHAMAGANLLVNLTNDAWFGSTSAPYQHLSMTVFRAVENRLPLIRAANTGFSAFIRPQGEIIALSTLFNEKTLKASIDIPNAPLTFYARFGDLFAFSLLAISLIKVLLFLWNRWIAGRIDD